MIARKYILNGKENFEKVEKEGKILQFPSFGLAYLAREDDRDSKFGFIVSTKVSKDSVQRNRIRRAINEAVRYQMTDIKKGFDIVFLAKQLALRKPTDQLMNETRSALKEAGIATR